MTSKTILLSGLAMSAFLASVPQTAIASANTPAYDPRYEDLAARLDSLESEVQSSQMKTADDMRAMSDVSKDIKGWWNDTKISGRMYFNLSNITHDNNGTPQSDEGFGFDIKRFYIGIDHKFDETFYANFTTDFLYDSTAGATQLYIKKAFLGAKISDMLDIKAGSTDLPWIPFVEDVYGYRFVENTLIDRTKFGTSADWGVHASGKLADGMISYALAVVDGAGYKHPFRSQGMDFEGRVNLNYQGFIFGVGGYVGKLGNNVQGATTFHTANRIDAIAAYTMDAIRVGFEYFRANDWNNVKTVSGEESEGYGGFASYQFTPQWSVFGKYEYVEPKQTSAPKLTDNYFNVGVNFHPTKIVDLALVYKRDKAEFGTISTSNGTIGGAVDGTYEEVGLFGQLRW